MRLVPLVLLIGFVAIACREDFENSYRTYDDAAADGAMRRGWLPDWLPPTATEIRERHNLDTNATYVSFTYGPADPRDFLASCGQTSRVELPSQRGWPTTKRERSALQYYRCEEHSTFAAEGANARETWVAIDQARAKAYFWR